MPIQRIAYFAQKGKVTLKDLAQEYIIPVNSANVEVTRPIESITAFGKFKSLNTAQTNITTCKSTLKCYLGKANGGTLSTIDHTFLNNLVEETQKGLITIEVGPQGFTMQGILTSIGIDISLGGFAMLDLGFAGVGNPIIADSQTSATTVADDAMSIQPVTTMSIGQEGGLTNTFATSIKFSYDLPTDTLGALGENPNGLQTDMKSIIATKAPYKSTITVEGYGIDISEDRTDAAIREIFGIGNIGVKLPNAKISARSFNNAAGQVSATFSLTAEDVGAEFSAVSLTDYAQQFDQTNLPMYGA